TSATGIAKYFNKNRGKALGVTALGNPAGQLILPLLIMPLIVSFGWRYSLLLLSVLAILMIIPSLWAITPVTPFEAEFTNNNKASNSKINYFTNNKFWVLAINTFTIPFLCTAIFLYQYLIGKNYGWSTQWVAFSFAFYAAFYALSLLLSGSLVDRFTGIRLFPIYLLPTLLVLIVITVSSNKWVFPLFYALLGISSGLGSTIRTAVQVEIYGKKDLGKLRSYISTIMVLSTAAGPPIFGFFIDKNYSLNSIMLGNAVFILLVILVSFTINSSHAFKEKE
ncbi:MAG: MFS transporter, partial [Paludibacteraceae bacterium]|nr:MFS transporter [Paludibacteraceae bacterium]